MSWITRDRIVDFVRSSFWFFPSLAMLAAWLIAKSILWFVACRATPA